MNWGSVSIDPTTSYMYVNDMRLGLANYMIPRDQVQGGSGIEMGVVPQLGTPSAPCGNGSCRRWASPVRRRPSVRCPQWT